MVETKDVHRVLVKALQIMVAREEVVAETANVEGLIPVPIPVPVPVLVPVLVLAARREAEEDLRDTTTSTIATAAILITETTITTTTSVEEETATTVEWTAAAATAVPARRRQTTETSSTSLPSRVNEVSRLPRGLPARRARKKASSVKLNRLPRNALDEESASPNFFRVTQPFSYAQTPLDFTKAHQINTPFSSRP